VSVQGLLMSNRRVANQVMSRIPADSHAKRGRSYAVKVAQTAIGETEAYPEFLREQLGCLPNVSTFEEFSRLPLTDKRNYINYERFGVAQLCLGGDPSRAYTIEKSSGHSGNCYYWLRTPAEDAMFPRYLEFAFAQFYGIESKRTLILITLALGTWTSGEKMAQALREVAATGKYPITVMAPGMHAQEVLEIVRDLSPMYDQTVIVGYPPFLKAVIDDGVRSGLDWPSLNVRLGLGGEGYSEQWRDQMGERLGVDPSRELLAISGGYGAADVGMTVGREYPLTVLVRRLCTQDESLASQLFFAGEAPDGTLPSLLQYNPATVFAEEVGGELVFTALSGIPIVRYNIHDRGGVLPFGSVMQALKEHGHDPYAMLEERGYQRQDVWNLPFLYCFGRSDGTVQFNGLNVHPEHIEAALSMLDDYAVVGFRLGVETAPESEHQRLVVLLEHRDPDASGAVTESDYGQALHEGLRAVNREFRHLHEIASDRTALRVEIHPRYGGPFASEQGSIKRHYVETTGAR
jgi:phenylacetate-coenzyme A ligase PaaK-like adenylate-forming protein